MLPHPISMRKVLGPLRKIKMSIQSGRGHEAHFACHTKNVLDENPKIEYRSLNGNPEKDWITFESVDNDQITIVLERIKIINSTHESAIRKIALLYSDDRDQDEKEKQHNTNADADGEMSQWLVSIGFENETLDDWIRNLVCKCAAFRTMRFCSVTYFRKLSGQTQWTNLTQFCWKPINIATAIRVGWINSSFP